jgi:hypothetical protein
MRTGFYIVEDYEAGFVFYNDFRNDILQLYTKIFRNDG